MKRREFLAVYAVNLTVLWICSGLLPLLPIYAAHLGATPVVTGNYLALAFLGTAAGTMGASWIAGRLRRRRILIIAGGLLSAPATWLMGQATTVWQLSLWTTVVWLLAGATLTLVSVLVGLAAGQRERGKVFGVLALTSSLAGVLGSSMSGPIADRWGYQVLLSVLAGLWFVQVGAALLLQEQRGTTTREDAPAHPIGRSPVTPWPLILLLVANFLLCTARFIGGMGQTLAMDAQGFTAAAVSLVAALGAGVGMLSNPLAGRLSDRIGRQTVLVIACGGGLLSLILMANASSLAQFMVVTALVTTAYAADAVAPALVTDLVPREHLDRWMSLFTTTRWIGAIVGYSGTGYAIQFFGLHETLLGSALLPLLAIAFLVQVRHRQGREPSLPSTLRQAASKALARTTEFSMGWLNPSALGIQKRRRGPIPVYSLTWKPTRGSAKPRQHAAGAPRL